MDICAMIKRVYELYSQATRFDCPWDYYEKTKKECINKYTSFPVTKIDLSDIPEEERRKRQIEIVKTEIERLNCL